MTRLLLVVLFVNAIAFYRCQENELRDNIIEIKHGGEPHQEMMYLNKNHWTMSMVIQENTLDDTSFISGVSLIPPGKTGLIMRADCFMDSTIFEYKPYKAKKGRLVIQYSSQGY